jgi:hypothetical protein
LPSEVHSVNATSHTSRGFTQWPFTPRGISWKGAFDVSSARNLSLRVRKLGSSKPVPTLPA